MQLPTLRRPVAASALAGIFGAGVVDALLSARGGATGQVLAIAIGLYGAVALLAGFGAALVAVAANRALFAPDVADEKMGKVLDGAFTEFLSHAISQYRIVLDAGAALEKKVAQVAAAPLQERMAASTPLR